MENAHTLYLVFSKRTLDEAPGIVELGLDGDMCLSEFLLVLRPEDLGEKEDERNECETRAVPHLELVVRQRNLCVCSVREFSRHEGGMRRWRGTIGV